MENRCNLCPRKCNIDRKSGQGFCGMGDNIRLARAALHFWEEPCISGTQGSGTVFFCGCNLKCVYCQNLEISRGNSGAEISEERLSEIFLELQEKGAHNINLVTPTHYTIQIKTALEAVRDKLKIPVVYNCGGYELPESLSLLSGLVDIYLTDIKYADNSLAKKYSLTENYFETAMSALDYMIKQVGIPKTDSNNILKSGVIVRHLVLPSHRQDSIKLLHLLKERFGTDSFILSLMSQFTPNKNLQNFPELNRRLTSFEYNCVADCAYNLGFINAYTQEKSSANEGYTPPFDLTGVL